METKVSEAEGGVRTYRGGWTLIEVLVVLAILLVLVGLVHAVGAYVLERSRQPQCISNLRQIGIALLQYMEDHKGRVAFITIFALLPR